MIDDSQWELSNAGDWETITRDALPSQSNLFDCSGIVLYCSELGYISLAGSYYRPTLRPANIRAKITDFSKNYKKG